jgi:hypothetical protein
MQISAEQAFYRRGPPTVRLRIALGRRVEAATRSPQGLLASRPRRRVAAAASSGVAAAAPGAGAVAAAAAGKAEKPLSPYDCAL